MKRTIAAGIALAVMLAACLAGAGAEEAGAWDTAAFLKALGKEMPCAATEVCMEAETESARLRVASAAYDGETLAFDVTLENKIPDTYLWCTVDGFTVNGRACTPEVITENGPGAEVAGTLPIQSLAGIRDHWLPGWQFPEGIARDGELIQLPAEAAGETARVELNVTVYRPLLPVMTVTASEGFREELERLIASGYYVIPHNPEDPEGLPEDGYFVPEADLEACPEGWAVAVSGQPPENLMGGVEAETLELCFTVAKGK